MTNKLIILFAILSVFLFFSCSNEKVLVVEDVIPTNLISKDTMINVLIDIHMADAIISQSKYVKNEKRNFSYSAYASVFRKYKITKNKFDNSLKYYSRTPDDINDIYDDVLNKMSELEGNSIANKGVTEKDK